MRSLIRRGLIPFIVLLLIQQACERREAPLSPGRLRFIGAPGVQVDVYEVGGRGVRALDTNQLIPLGSMRTGHQYALPPGQYYAVNECSSIFFELVSAQERVLHLKRLVLELGGGDSQVSDFPNLEDQVGVDTGPSSQNTGHVIPSECVNPYNGMRRSWTDRLEFEVLPGQVTLLVGGRALIDELLENNAESLHFGLQAVDVLTLGEETHAQFFARAMDQKSLFPEPVVAAQVGSRLWLLPGHYTLELNGSQLPIELSLEQPITQMVGALRVLSPQDFPMQDRIKVSGKPIFAYVNDGVIFTLDHSYLLFPGTYNVSLDGGDVRSDYRVEAGARTDVRTKGALIKTPPCPEEQESGCHRSPRITIHRENRPFVLMTVETGVPFLVLDQEYEFGVEGIRGVLKRLRASDKNLAVETLARVQLEWQVRKGASKVRTDLVRLETKSEPLFGRSLDLLFSKPTEVYVPAGAYELTYFVGEPSQERKKTRRSLFLRPGQTAALVVPLYSDKITDSAMEQIEDRNRSPGVTTEPSESAELPVELQPIQ